MTVMQFNMFPITANDKVIMPLRSHPISPRSSSRRPRPVHEAIKGAPEITPVGALIKDVPLKITILARGESQKDGKFLLVGKGGETVLLSVRRLSRRNDREAEFEKLEALDFDILSAQARNNFLREASAATNMPVTFDVVTQIGWFEEWFVLPEEVFPRHGKAQSRKRNFIVTLDPKDCDIHSRFRCHGSSERLNEAYQLCRGNSRLILAAILGLVGPCCAPFRLRPPGIQFVGDHGCGKTVAAIITGAANGGVPQSALGFAWAWNATPNGIEEFGPAHRGTTMVFDETSVLPADQSGRPLAFGETIMRLNLGQTKKRFGAPVDLWSSTLVSTSNFSVYALLDARRRQNYGAFTDRLMDVPAPNRGYSYFEELHGFKDEAAFGKYLFDLGTMNFGHTLPKFLDRLTSALGGSREGVRTFVDRRIGDYQTAADDIKSSHRSVLRVRDFFATVYAVGCLARQLKVLPFERDEVMAAVLSCHRDHVAFVDNEVAGGVAWSRSNHSGAAPSCASDGDSSDTIAQPTQLQPFEQLQRFVKQNGRDGFMDCTKSRGASTFKPSNVGYFGEHAGRPEIWLRYAKFVQVAGGKQKAAQLKLELLQKKLIVTERRSGKVSYVVKRMFPNGQREYVVALRRAVKAN